MLKAVSIIRAHFSQNIYTTGLQEGDELASSLLSSQWTTMRVQSLERSIFFVSQKQSEFSYVGRGSGFQRAVGELMVEKRCHSGLVRSRACSGVTSYL